MQTSRPVYIYSHTIADPFADQYSTTILSIEDHYPPPHQQTSIQPLTRRPVSTPSIADQYPPSHKQTSISSIADQYPPPFQQTSFDTPQQTSTYLPSYCIYQTRIQIGPLIQSGYQFYSLSTVVTNIKRNDCCLLHGGISISNKE